MCQRPTTTTRRTNLNMHAIVSICLSICSQEHEKKKGGGKVKARGPEKLEILHKIIQSYKRKHIYDEIYAVEHGSDVCIRRGRGGVSLESKPIKLLKSFPSLETDPFPQVIKPKSREGRSERVCPAKDGDNKTEASARRRYVQVRTWSSRTPREPAGQAFDTMGGVDGEGSQKCFRFR